MYVRRPVFTLKRLCLTCGQPTLDLLTCSACRAVVAVFGGDGDVLKAPFDDVSACGIIKLHSDQNPCPCCGSPVQFDLASGDEIQAAGVSAEDYS